MCWKFQSLAAFAASLFPWILSLLAKGSSVSPGTTPRGREITDGNRLNKHGAHNSSFSEMDFRDSQLTGPPFPRLHLCSLPRSLTTLLSTVLLLQQARVPLGQGWLFSVLPP